VDEAIRERLLLGKSFFARRQYGQAERYLSEVIEQNPAFADVYNMLGVIYHDGGQFSRAERAFRAAIKLNPAYTEAGLNLAVLLNDMGRYEEARGLYQDAISHQKARSDQMDPVVVGKIANLYADLGDAWAASGKQERALAEYEHAVDLCPNFVDIRLKRAVTLRELSRLPEALAELEAILRTSPQYLPGRLQYGVTLQSAGQLDEAAKAFEQVLAVSPGHRSAEVYLRLVNEARNKQQS
jgi:tetratricopeptide (TPR) repeat protein